MGDIAEFQEMINDGPYRNKDSRAIERKLESLGYDLRVAVDLKSMKIRIEDPGVRGYFADHLYFCELSDKQIKEILEKYFIRNLDE